MKKQTLALIMATMMLSSTVSASSYDVETMTQEELKQAVLDLESQNAELEEQIKDLKVQLFDLQQGSNTEEVIEEEQTEESTETVEKTTEEFLEDIKTSYDKRSTVVDKYTISEINTLSNDEFVKWRQEAVEKEEEFYEEYKNAVFKDLNIQYLCRTYCDGVQSQKQATDRYFIKKDYDSYTTEWTSAYNKRSYVIVELAEYYNVPFGDITDMKENVAALDSLNEAETRNASVDKETVRKTQELLNTIGFFCGSADGVSGKRTVKSIKRFQEMYGYEIDGIIDEELIGQLEAVAAEKGTATSSDQP